MENQNTPNEETPPEKENVLYLLAKEVLTISAIISLPLLTYGYCLYLGSGMRFAQPIFIISAILIAIGVILSAIFWIIAHFQTEFITVEEAFDEILKDEKDDDFPCE